MLEGLKTEEEKQEVSDITVYPNPTNGIVNISLPQDAKYKGIEIYSVMGRIVHKEDAKKDRLNIAINLSNNKRGLYFIKVKFDDYVITKKIILK